MKLFEHIYHSNKYLLTIFGINVKVLIAANYSFRFYPFVEEKRSILMKKKADIWFLHCTVTNFRFVWCDNGFRH